MSRQKTVLVIGGGVSGLVAGGLLARNGHRVRLLEANRKLGGCCGGTQLDGYTFNDGAVFLVMRSVLETVFERLGLDRAALLPLRRVSSNSTTWLPDDSVVTHGDGLEVTVEGGPGRFDAARTREELEALVRAWEPLYRLLTQELMFEPVSAWTLLTRAWRYLPRLFRTMASELRRSVSAPAVRAALAGSILYSGVPAEQAPAIGLVGLVALFVEGTYLPEGGMGRIPEALSHAVLRSGGQISLGTSVERILVEGGRVRGVEVRGEGRVEADVVVSTLSGVVTFGRLLDPTAVPAALAHKARTAALSQRAVSIQLGLRNRLDAPSYNLSVLPEMEEQHRYFQPGQREVQWLAWSVPTTVDPHLAPAGGSVVELFPPIEQDVPVEAWDEARKARVLDATLQALSKRHALDVAVTRVRGPREFQGEMHLHQGALYGLSPATSPLAMFPHRTRVPGLYQAGQTTWPGYSVPMAAVSGLLTAEAVMKDLGSR